jgi:aquaporin Z
MQIEALFVKRARARKSGEPAEWQRLTAEFVGTFFSTLVANGADVLDFRTGGGVGHTSRFLARGFIVSAMIWSLSGVSGAHINPAVTLGFVLRGSFPIARAVRYWIAQFAGGIAAAMLLMGFFGNDMGRGASHPGAGVAPLAAVLWEAMLTALLVLVILSTAHEEAVVGKNAALAVGLAVAACGLFGSPMTGASMNPARSFGPLLLSGQLPLIWIYVVGPLLGAAIAAAVATLILGSSKRSERSAARGTHNG